MVEEMTEQMTEEMTELFASWVPGIWRAVYIFNIPILTVRRVAAARDRGVLGYVRSIEVRYGYVIPTWGGRLGV